MIHTYKTGKEFLEVSQPLLEKNEAENNLILGLAASLLRDINYYGKVPPLFLTVHLENKIVGACLQTPPRNLIIYASKEYLNKSIPEVCDYLIDNQIDIPGIIGPKETVLKFNKIWTSIKNVSTNIQIDEMVYKLEKVNKVPISKGQLRQAKDSDLNLVSKWVRKFHKEAIGSISELEATELATKKIKEGAIYLWETDQAVSMAGWTRPTKNGITVAFVYTPPEFRNKGFATSCVAMLSELLLSQYSFCSLFTDLSNPTSNNIYQKIGYQSIDRVLQCQFLKM